MARFNPYLHLEPAEEQQRKEASYAQQMHRDQNALIGEANRLRFDQDANYWDYALNKAVEWYSDEDDDYVLEQAEKIEKSLTKEKRLHTTAKGKVLLDIINEGVAVRPEEVLKTQQQQQAIRTNKPYTRTHGQTMGALLRDAPDEDKFDLLAGDVGKYQQQYDELMAEELMGAERKVSGGFADLMHVLGIFGLGAQGGLAGATQALREEYGITPAEEEDSTLYKALRGFAMGAAMATPAGPIAKFVADSLEKPTFLGVDKADIYARPSGLLEVLSRAGEYAGRSMAGGIGAVDWTNELRRTAEAYKQHAIKTAAQQNPDATDEEVLTASQELLKKYLANDVAQLALEHPEAAQVVAEIGLDPTTYLGNIMVTGPAKMAKMGVQALAKKSPTVGRSLEALAKGSEKAGKAVRESDIGKAIGEQVERVKRGVTHRPEYRAIGKQGGEAAEEAVSKARMGEAVATTATREAAQEVEDLTAKLTKETKKWSDDEHALLYDYLDRPDQLPAGTKLPGHMHKAEGLARLIAKKMWESKVQTGVMERWSANPAKRGVLEQIERRQHYVPHKKFVKPDDAIEPGTPGPTAEMPGSGLSSSDKARTGAPRNVVKNVPQQFEAASREMIPKQSPVWELKLSDKALREGDFIADVERVPGTIEGAGRLSKLWGQLNKRGGIGEVRKYYLDEISKSEKRLANSYAIRDTLSPNHRNRMVWDSEVATGERVVAEQRRRLAVVEGRQQINEMVAQMEARTGVPMEVMEDSLYKPYREIVGSDPLGTGRKIDKLASHITIVPREFAKLAATLVPAARNEAEIYKFLDGAHKGFIRPYMQIWRQTKTIWGGPAFSVRNFVGGFGLSTIALGLKAFDPELQMKAMSAAFLAASGSKSAEKALAKMSWTLRNGKKVRLLDVVESAKKVGLTSQMEFHLAQDMVSKGPMQRVVRELNKASEFWGAPGARYLSPAYPARATENYQHLVTYMGALDDLTEKGIAKALDFSSKFSSNYMRMGTWEKGVLRDTIGFYGWLRFIMPHMTQQLWENPGRVSAWLKSVGGIERYTGREAPFSQHGVPHHLKAYGVTAMPSAQPSQHVQNMGSHQYAMMMVENPATMGFGLAPAIGSALGPEARGPRMLEMAGPLFQMAVDMMTGKDLRTGEDLPPFFDRVSGGFSDFLYAPVERPAGILKAVYDLYFADGRPAQAYELYLRYKVGRDLLGLDNWGARAVGAEPRSLGGMTDPETGGFLGASVYPVDPLRQAYGKKRDLIRGRGWQEHVTRKGLERYGY